MSVSTIKVKPSIPSRIAAALDHSIITDVVVIVKNVRLGHVKIPKDVVEIVDVVEINGALQMYAVGNASLRDGGTFIYDLETAKFFIKMVHEDIQGKNLAIHGVMPKRFSYAVECDYPKYREDSQFGYCLSFYSRGKFLPELARFANSKSKCTASPVRHTGQILFTCIRQVQIKSVKYIWTYFYDVNQRIYCMHETDGLNLDD